MTIYAIRNTETKIIVYVGKTKKALEDRYKEHTIDKMYLEKMNYLANHPCQIEALFTGITESRAHDVEQICISKYDPILNKINAKTTMTTKKKSLDDSVKDAEKIIKDMKKDNQSKQMLKLIEDRITGVNKKNLDIKKVKSWCNDNWSIMQKHVNKQTLRLMIEKLEVVQSLTKVIQDPLFCNDECDFCNNKDCKKNVEDGEDFFK